MTGKFRAEQNKTPPARAYLHGNAHAGGLLMEWILFFAGMLVGGLVGVFLMCLCVLAGEETRREEHRDFYDDRKAR